MSWSLSRKVSLALAFILLLSMAATVFFGRARFEDALSGLVQSRYSFVVFTIRQKIEDRLNLGFTLRQLRQVQDLIELEKSREGQILGIQVYDAHGEVLFDTDRGTLGARVPAAWLEPLADSMRDGGHAFSLRDDDSLLVGMPLVNGLGRIEGAVALRTSATFLDREMGAVLRRLAPEFLAVLGGCLAFGIMVSVLVLRGVGRRLARMQTVLDATVRGIPADESGLNELAKGPLFEHRFAAFCGKSREVIEQLDDAAAEVERADRLA